MRRHVTRPVHRQRLRRILGIWCIVALVAACPSNASPPQDTSRLGGPTPRHTAGVTTSTSGEAVIAFEAEEGIVTVHPDGSNRTIVTSAVVTHAFDPQWSPSSGRLVFVCTFGDNGEIQNICTIRRDGSGLRRLTHSESAEFSPDWSPSGRWIAFNRGGHIFLIRPNGDEMRRVPNTGNAGHLGWRHNNRIVFTRGSRDGGDIYTIRRNGLGRQRLTFPHAGDEDEPQWSPDGRRIVFMRLTGVGKFDIFKMRSDGSRVRRLTRRCCSTASPTWSPSGRQILFLDLGLYKMKSDGRDVERVPNARDAGPADWTRP